MFRCSVLLFVSILGLAPYALGQDSTLTENTTQMKLECAKSSLKVLKPTDKEFAGHDATKIDGSVHSWSVTIQTFGGFGGVGKGNYSINSRGEVRDSILSEEVKTVEISKVLLDKASSLINSCNPANIDNLQVLDAKSTDLVIPAFSAVCSDCYSITMTVKRNRYDNTTLISWSSWVEGNYSRVSGNMKEIYQEIMLIIENNFDLDN